MAMTAPQVASMQRGGGPGRLADVLDVLLDKGLVIDAFVRVSLVGIELLTIDARIVVASVDTYLRFAEAVNRLDLTEVGDQAGLPDLLTGSRQDGDESEGRSDGQRRGGGERQKEQSQQRSERAERSGDDEGDGKEDADGSGLIKGVIGKAAQKVMERGKW